MMTLTRRSSTILDTSTTSATSLPDHSSHLPPQLIPYTSFLTNPTLPETVKTLSQVTLLNIGQTLPAFSPALAALPASSSTPSSSAPYPYQGQTSSTLRRQGRGTQQYPGGCFYEGEWDKDVKSGIGLAFIKGYGVYWGE